MDLLTLLLLVIVLILCYLTYNLNKQVKKILSDLNSIKNEANKELVPQSVNGITMNYL